MTDSLAGFRANVCGRIIVKVGSALLVSKDGEVRRDWLKTLVAEIAARHRAGQKIIIVSSGAIALGARRLGLAKGGRSSLEDAQAAAAVGQIALSGIWAELLQAEGVTSAQILVTLDDLEHRRRYLNASATLERLLGLGVIPVVNENDSVATAEIKFGDNDRLAARIGQAAHADAVVLLSDIDGLYTANPHVDPSAELVPLVERIDAKITGMATTHSASGMGSGGMASKVEAARIANRAGLHLAIISGRVDAPLTCWIQSGRGTIFKGDRRKTARKNWLAGRLTVRGTLAVDDGAAAALTRGRSLLPAGVKDTNGDYRRGDVVNITNADGHIIARGLAEFDADDAARIIGHRSEEIEAILGSVQRSVLVHRDHMVVL
ncbi:MAG TPA: glutamate 5-kinase [Sphingobium sp.]|uniref:glutamate 5-kinase n=1 Tax=Sphingobium sp. TaxID=1912891 RepID=UPI002ED2D4C5